VAPFQDEGFSVVKNIYRDQELAKKHSPERILKNIKRIFAKKT